MAAIVYLDVDDEITSAAARIRKLEDDRIALVLPLGSRLSTSRINFRLLAREAEARGKKIEIVTNDASARALAASAGLATHVSVAAFEAGPLGLAGPGDGGPGSGPPGTGPGGPAAGGLGAGSAAGSRARTAPPPADDSPTTAIPVIHPPVAKPSPVPQVGRRPPARPRARIVAAVLALVAVLLGTGTAAFLLLPSAEIVLVPATDTIGPLELNVTAQSGVTRPDPVNLLVPATRFTFDVEVSDTFPATGVKVTETAAAGEVTFSSLNTGGSNTIRSGSIVRTEAGIEFRTLAEVELPPADVAFIPGQGFVVVPSTRKVAVEAVTPGLSGNVAANTIVVVPEDENPMRTTVTNETATAGGTHVESPQVQQSDITAALAALDTALTEAFDQQVVDAVGVPDGTTLFPETRNLGEPTPSVDPSTLVGTDAAEFELGAAAEGTVIGVDPAPVETLADARIRNAVDDGFRLDEATITIDVGQPIVAGTVITFPVTVRASQTRIVDADALMAEVRGLGLPQARTVLGEYGEVTITVWPDWVTTIPENEGRATLTIVEPDEDSGDATGVPSGTPSGTEGTAP
ncbi:MAG TPA: baseplate J/gp47 family protein [Candidatus Limnocylindrales bacterium]|nr:baseplate J/gp47 family protein [Candidatus Limnocylindrales bacterium]